MNARAAQADPDVLQAAIARLHAPVDAARATYRGMTLVGHRDSVRLGEMAWALPGGGVLVAGTPDLQVIDAPHNGWLRDQQPVLEALTS